MAIRQVSFASRQQAESIPGGPATAVISITDPGTPPAKLRGHFKDILRISFFDAVPADEFLPAPLPGLFDHRMARKITQFVEQLKKAPEELSIIVHCEYGVSRSAAVALFTSAYSGAPLNAREYAYDANQWVVDRLQLENPGIQIEIPDMDPTLERRKALREN